MSALLKEVLSAAALSAVLCLSMGVGDAEAQATLQVKPADGDEVRTVGKLPSGAKIVKGQLSLPRGYRVQRRSKDRATFSSAPSTGSSASTRLATPGSKPAGGSGTLECDGCCDVAATGTPPKLQCKKNDNCGCITTITIK